MKIRDDLERTIEQGFQEWVKDDTDFEMGGYSIATKHAALVEKALPALIRVARAAEKVSIEMGRLDDAVGYDWTRLTEELVTAEAELDNALHELRATSEGGKWQTG